MSDFRELTDNQARMLTDTRQLHEAYAHARDMRAKFPGSMTWREKNGTRYLTKILDSHGGQRSLGKESDETQATYEAFKAGKGAAIKRLKMLDGKMEEQARFNRAARLGRVPRTAARILRRFEEKNLLGHGITVIGTNALYAYEAEAGVMFDREQTATSDIDLLWDVRQRLQLTTEISEDSVIGLLKDVDPSFNKTRAYRAINDEGYFVDLVRPTSTPVGYEDGFKSIGSSSEDLEAAEIEGLWWITNVPSLTSVAVADDGYPVQIVAPHPLAYAAHKMWVSRRIEREAVKKRRDEAQSHLVERLVHEYLPQWRYDDKLLQALPKQLRALVGKDEKTKPDSGS
jgi:hypothetical protein